MSKLDELARAANKQERQLRARALRAIRKIDRPLAVYALKRWKDSDEISKAAFEALVFGLGAVRVQHIPDAWEHFNQPAPEAP
jgi:hypothetical protein